ncbi:NUDIX hydrolase [Nonomuraea africana]|uniref:8-oxo-dGTP pyrophosphatase MutT (NUDIX family) n=1 Tax=Nonomuraea africana TaxID=46171 RepID=A0ABR9KSQ9_9ACTN|nr:NUDIX domain-containing protein [Nonomuraea africana]MBE1565070.1 8-oxo-dGTP pyrophosphatase MutT (NUDIX family) [Nonomuraea africana]
MRRSERLLYAANGVDLRVADVTTTDGGHVERPFIRTHRAAGAVVFHGGSVLLLWRHQLITDTWGWEIPLGEIGPGEEPEAAAARHVEEQTGWRPGPLLPLIRIRPAGDVADCDHLIFVAHEASPCAAPAGDEEDRRAEWMPMPRVQPLIDEQAITSATTSAALLHFLADLLQARASH